MNLLLNGDFEGGVVKHDWGFVPEHWQPYCGGNHKPEFKVVDMDLPRYQDPPRACEGTHALQYYAQFAPYCAGVTQLVTGLTPLATYVLSASFHAWSSGEDDPHDSTGAGSYSLYAQLGVGFGQPQDVLWSPELYSFDVYRPFELPFVAPAADLTIYLQTVAKFGLRHEDCYWDNVRLQPVDSPTPPTPVPPTGQYIFHIPAFDIVVEQQ